MNRKVKISVLLILSFIIINNQALAADLTGRVSFRSYMISEIDNPLVSKYIMPSTRIKLNFNNLLASGLNFNIYFRGDRRMGEDEFIRTKLYDFRLTTPRLLGRLEIGAGRLNTAIAGSYGLLDGVNTKFYFPPFLSFGAFGGAVPDYRNFEISTETQRYGGYLSFDSKKYNGSISLITQRYKNEIDRRYFSIQNDFAIRDFLTVFNGAELDIKNYEDGEIVDKPKWTYFYLNTRFVPFKFWSTDLSYTYRQDFKYLRSMSFLPDSLFNAVVSKRYGIRMRIRPFSNWTLTGNFRYGLRDDNNENEKYVYLNISNNNLLNQHIYISARLGKNMGYYAEGNGWYFFVEKSIFRKLRLSANLNGNKYKSKIGDCQYTKNIAGLNISYRWNRHINTYLRFDRVLGGKTDQSRMLVEFSYRFLKDRKNGNK